MQTNKRTKKRPTRPTAGRVFGYVRVSTHGQAGDGESLGQQQRQLEGWAYMQGQPLAQVFVERGVSGSVPVAERPQGNALWVQLRAGDKVVAAKLDRLFRSALDALQTVSALRERGVSLVLLDLGGDISGNGLSKMFLTIAAAFAEAERDRIRERITVVKQDQKARGRYLGGWVPFGYEVGADGELIENTEQQAAIKQAYRMRKRGRTFRAIQDTLAMRGHKLSLAALHRVLSERQNH